MSSGAIFLFHKLQAVIMDQFIVSARKYRPQTFDTVVGQRHITTTLKNAILQQHLAHAFLFCGPRGVGKTTCARILAKTINCENLQPNGEACDQCASCRSFNEGMSLNIHELDAASNNSVEDIRTLTEQVRFVPQMGKYKVYIIDEVHMLSSSAFNAFLKTLEEPPPYAIFILATTEKHKILPTILSRCQIFDFKRITTKDTVEHLEEIIHKEDIQAEKSALELIAQKSEGCMRDALSILDKMVSFTGGNVTYENAIEHLNILDADYFFRFLAFMQKEDMPGTMLLYDEINRKGFEADIFLQGMAEFFRNLFVCKDAKVAELLESVESFKERYLSAAKETSASFIISALNILNEAEIHLRQSRNKRLHIEMTLIKLTYLNQAIDLSAGSVQKKNDNVKPVRFRTLQPIILNEKKSAEKNTPAAVYREVPEEKQAKLIIEEEPKKTVPRETENKKTTPATPAPSSISSLSKIRERVSQQLQTEIKTKTVDQENLREVWNAYIQQLKKDQKNSTATNFEMMEVKVIANNQINVVCTGDIQLGFYQQEKNNLLDYLKDFFGNRNLSIETEFIEITREETQKGPVLSIKDQYLQMAEKYPVIKELKDRLGLELDY
jgi:DNA polymerase-3 subunit gamma/tau